MLRRMVHKMEHTTTRGGMMLEKYCATCDEVRVILKVQEGGTCGHCGGSIRDCDCSYYCFECEEPFEGDE